MSTKDLQNEHLIEAGIQTILGAKREQIIALGTAAVSAFADGGKAQMSGLERAGLTAQTFNDIIYFVKRQVARKQFEVSFGGKLLAFLETLEKEALDLAGSHPNIVRNRMASRLGGVFMRQLNSEYMFQIMQER